MKQKTTSFKHYGKTHKITTVKELDRTFVFRSNSSELHLSVDEFGEVTIYNAKEVVFVRPEKKPDMKVRVLTDDENYNAKLTKMEGE